MSSYEPYNLYSNSVTSTSNSVRLKGKVTTTIRFLTAFHMNIIYEVYNFCQALPQLRVKLKD